MSTLRINQLRSRIEGGDILAVREFLEKGGDPDGKAKPGRPLIYIAASYGRTSIVELLISSGADINSADKFGHTALYAAAFGGHEKTVEALINHGASTGRLDELFGSLLAYGKDRERIVDLLITWQQK